MADAWDAFPDAAQSPHAAAISSIESGGNYRAVGPETGKGRALGKYQVMSFNVGPWTEQALGQRLTPTQFMNSPEAQDKVFEHIFGGYVKKYGPEGAAKAWFAGEGGMNNPNARDVLGTTVSAYADKFNRASGQEPKPAVSNPSDPWGAFPDAPQAAPATDAPLKITVGKQPDIGRGTALMEGVRSGVTANFGDELAGVAAASGYPDETRNIFSGPANAIVGLGRLAYGALTGDDTAANQYAAGRDKVRETQKAAEEQYPGANLAGQVAGAVVLPAGGMLNAATLPLRMARGAAVGAGYGGAAGVGEGTTVEDRATKGAVGLVAGGVLGGLGVPAVEGLVKGATAAVATPINYLRAAYNPTGAAQRAIGRTFQEATEADPGAVGRLSESQLSPTGPQAVIDVLGEPGRRLARDASNMAGASAEPLNRTLNDRYAAQFGRFSDWLSDRMQHKDLHAFQRAEDALEKTVNRANYGKAYKDGSDGLWSPELERLIGADEVVEAMKNAASTGRGRAIADGMGGFNSAVTFENGVLKFNKGKNGVPSYPDLQFWDYTRRELSGAAKKAARAGDNDSAGYLKKLADLMNKELDNLVPSYQDARQGAFKFFQADNAVEAGQKFVTENFDVPRALHAMSKMTPEQRTLFKDAFLERYIATLAGRSDRADLVKQIYESPRARQKLQAVLGPQEANALEAMLHAERVMSRSLGGVTGNSTAAQQLIAHGVAGASGGGAAGYGLGYDPTSSGLLIAALTAGRRGIDISVAKKVAEMLISKDPAVLNRGLRMIANNNRMMTALRSADSATARISGGQAHGIPVPAMQAQGIGRAEDEQPNVPRPSGQ